jgi:hypothetical protein
MSARIHDRHRRGVTVGDVYRIGANGWRVVRLSSTRAWCEPVAKNGPHARWLYLEVLTSAATLDNGGNDGQQ